ncbi:Di-copper centre-containing protein [Mycena vulgaris]|nr:Di-copper centre-containing protein [Mycena vulgaris]
MSRLLTLSFFFVSLLLLGGATQTGNCTHPAVRKEWRSLSHEDKGGWIAAVNCLANIRSNKVFVASVNPPDIAAYNASGSLFDDFVYAHMDLNHHIHMTGFFFPWHRWHIYSFDQALRNSCGYQGPFPYWDWTQDAANFYESPFFKDSDPTTGMGGWGDASTQFRVLDGGFSASSPFRLSYPFPHTLRRNFTLFPPLEILFPVPGYVWNHTRPANASFTQPVVDRLIDGFEGDFKGFQAQMEGAEGPHLNVHFIIGGDAGGSCPSDAPAGCTPGPTFSANDPLFFLHHAMVDRIWFKWQQRHPRNRHAFAGGSVQRFESAAIFSTYPTGGAPFLTLDSVIPADGLAASPLTVLDMMSTTEGPLCYVYD